tara:strand:- start:815 stop:1585 length:771 start_codon:yes stop_codon:yes gene_type:complete
MIRKTFDYLIKQKVLLLLCWLGMGAVGYAAEPIGYGIGWADALTNSETFSSSINLLLSMSSIGLIPFFIMSTTSFIRIVIVFSLIRTALGTGQSPPNPIILVMSVFMTIYIMSPTMQQVYDQAIVPYNDKKITQSEAMRASILPFQLFMSKHIREKDLALFVELSQENVQVEHVQDIPLYVLVPAFIISELKVAFQIAFLVFIPFVVIDLLVANILMSLGMFMLSPVMISLPFKILLFVLIDGWHLLIKSLMISYQ